jgi:hypothetical protein
MLFKKVEGLAIQKEIPTSGHSPLLVMGDDYKLYVVKNNKGKNLATELINEFLANFLLYLWNIKVPNAVYFNLDAELLESGNYSSFHKKHYYNDTCFGSEFFDPAIDLNDLMSGTNKVSYNHFNNPKDFFHIALFDIWVENDDRKPSNYNLIEIPESGKFTIIPIDHAFIFGTLKYEQLSPLPFTPSDNEHILISDLGYIFKKYTNINENFITFEREYFYLCIDKCKKEIDKFFLQINKTYDLDENSVIKLKEFLFNTERNEKVFIEYLYRISQ